MDVTFTQQIETRRVFKLTTDGPVDLKNHGFVWGVMMRKFKELNGREPSSDNDVWLEPYNEGIAYCFEVKTVEKVA